MVPSCAALLDFPNRYFVDGINRLRPASRKLVSLTFSPETGCYPFVALSWSYPAPRPYRNPQGPALSCFHLTTVSISIMTLERSAIAEQPLRAACLLFLLFAASSLAFSATLNPGDVFQVEFSIVDPAACPNGTCNALIFSPDYLGFSGAAPSAVLYNGGSVIGTLHETGTCCVAQFYSESGGFSSVPDYAALADFTSIQDGTIQGVLDYSVTGGSLQDFDPATSLFTIGDSQAVGGVSSNSEAFTIESETIITPTPEPMWGSLALAACFVLALKHRYRAG
jgi:hypothetical protein